MANIGKKITNKIFACFKKVKRIQHLLKNKEPDPQIRKIFKKFDKKFIFNIIKILSKSFFIISYL